MYHAIDLVDYPQYEHAAVIVAEDITSRFLNVIGLFNGHIPLIALQMSALKSGEQIGLVFSKVVDLMTFGLVDEDEEPAATRHQVSSIFSFSFIWGTETCCGL
ncbi:MAG TPA: hypothetical protein EYG03_18970 [Planctomycetes bacterium]|nr:hypothetical protein [Fuerstiella sp.]HIK94033.1 hypothetical protein [Planctomycetota bacterium]